MSLRPAISRLHKTLDDFNDENNRNKAENLDRKGILNQAGRESRLAFERSRTLMGDFDDIGQILEPKSFWIKRGIFASLGLEGCKGSLKRIGPL